jgi:hypothetical protein
MTIDTSSAVRKWIPDQSSHLSKGHFAVSTIALLEGPRHRRTASWTGPRRGLTTILGLPPGDVHTRFNVVRRLVVLARTGQSSPGGADITIEIAMASSGHGLRCRRDHAVERAARSRSRVRTRRPEQPKRRTGAHCPCHRRNGARTAAFRRSVGSTAGRDPPSLCRDDLLVGVITTIYGGAQWPQS